MNAKQVAKQVAKSQSEVAKLPLGDLAKKLGVTKPTVVQYAKELGIYEELEVIDGRRTRVAKQDQASAIADAISKSNAELISSVMSRENEGRKEEKIAKSDFATQSQSRKMDRKIEELRAELKESEAARVTAETRLEERERQLIAAEGRIDALEEREERLRSKLARAEATISQLAAAHWWQKQRIIASYALPAPREE